MSRNAELFGFFSWCHTVHLKHIQSEREERDGDNKWHGPWEVGKWSVTRVIQSLKTAQGSYYEVLRSELAYSRAGRNWKTEIKKKLKAHNLKKNTRTFLFTFGFGSIFDDLEETPSKLLQNETLGFDGTFAHFLGLFSLSQQTLARRFNNFLGDETERRSTRGKKRKFKIRFLQNNETFHT